MPEGNPGKFCSQRSGGASWGLYLILCSQSDHHRALIFHQDKEVFDLNAGASLGLRRQWPLATAFEFNHFTML